MEENYNFLVNKFLDLKESRKQSKNKGVHDYSLMASLLRINDEVRLHSRFIFSMINPKSLHYRNDMFLKTFLNQLKGSIPDNFIDTTQAEVYLEKDNIDLLIHDGTNYLIIENKLDAVDQANQITRYISYVQTNFFEEGDDINGNVAIVYLSKSKEEPSKLAGNKEKNYSLIGFELIKEVDGLYLEWKGIPKPKPEKLTSFDLDTPTKLPYFHLPYFTKGALSSSGSVNNWICESLKVCRDTPFLSGSSIKMAFDEYQKILNRLEKPNSWKNIMTLSDYAQNLTNENNSDNLNEQQAMYQFMVESRNSIVDFVAQVLFKEVDTLFSIDNCEALPDNINSDTDSSKPFNVDTIKCWLHKGNNFKNVGFIYENSKSDKVIFLLADWHLYISKYDIDTKEYAENDNTRVKIGKNREELLKNGNLYTVIDKIKTVALRLSL